MRMIIKGGVWNNTEDEILKAAVMKYGKNQWSRIQTLLVRKSYRQCKARWFEWLDPSIKKTEWTRQEDERLLHLAKLMPSQWRSIAGIVGRTSMQCLERYERLLDAACARDGNYDAGDDPRKLRPGEVDSNAESRPARPDPVDMDDDEIEMLSEARARLANTRGKKAKRKAREKQLDEARRLAALQKRRELKAAGLDNGHRNRKRNGIDYIAEVPFEKRPPLGFYDTTHEIQKVERIKFPITVDEIEGEKRCDKEARLRRQDAARNSILHRQDAPSAMLQVNKLNDPEAAVRKRSKLNLPTPQIPDHELEHIAKFRLPEEFPGGSVATRALLVDYAQTPHHVETSSLRTPLRTPASKHDAIMMEAENQARLRLSQTPLLGGDNPELHPSDFSASRVGITPSRDGASLGKGTPIRDELHINGEMDMSAKLELPSHADLRRNLRSGLTSLPQPKYEYQIMVQPIPEDNEELEEKMEEDMSDRTAREKAGEEAKLQDLLKKRSEVLQRGLPRPSAASLQLLKNSLLTADKGKSSVVPPTLIEQANEMIRKELLSLLEHDKFNYPTDEKVRKEKRKDTKFTDKGNSAAVPLIDQFEEDELKEADHHLRKECMVMCQESESFDDFVEAHKTCLNDMMYFPTRKAYGLSSVAGNIEKISALQDEFEHVRRRLDNETKKADRIEQKIKLLTNGYQNRGTNLWSQVEAKLKPMDKAGTDLKCFHALRNQEQLAESHRVDTLWEEVKKQKELEETLQKRYGYLLSEQERIQNLMNNFRAKQSALCVV
ncbi:Cell division cycle 5 [Heracleum sosnowskyi]|uniref:Cell division cycle 5 n=1 Tax=Heracleum sosnowskyi TaxID=360622 RepID=A0AAD8JDY6_9APIA|nr:Cell division cycle 5 [Heracleum sosnowskyi]